MRRFLLIGLGVALPCIVNAQELTLKHSPELGVETVVPAGGEVYSFTRVYTLDGARLEADSGPGSYLRGRSISVGTELVSVGTKAAFKACVPIKGTFEPDGPCFLDDDGDGRFDRQATNDYNLAQRLKIPVPYSRLPISVYREDSLRRVFLFQGATQDSLRFSYREFSAGLARPAFTEELTIQLAEFPLMIQLKDIQLMVLRVDGMGMRYKVVRAN
ncbi:hypothetical protein [Parasphingorhabdus sp.]|uniref:hypothetical protein n=1 Tax=Parasphingorhabdus sp. TaxID=2709688 RepID=UPI0030015E3E